MTSLQQIDQRIAFIGTGNMATSIIGGMIRQGYRPELITATARTESKLAVLQKEFGIQTTTDNQAACRQADIVMLCVKPQMMADVVQSLSDCLIANKPLLISVAAGVTLARFEQWANTTLPMIRTMPNTPALVQEGATGLYANERVSDQQKAIAQAIFEAIGLAIWFNQETSMDQVVAVSGSGPAYYFLVMEAMELAAIKLGMDPAAARQLTLQTALGAAKLATESEYDPAELRRRVTSPGGTTEQAINCLQQGGLVELFEQAMSAAMRRSQELAG